MLKGMDLSLAAYWVCFALGTGYAAISAILGGFFGLAHHGGDIGVGHMDMGHEYGGGGHEAGGHGEAFAAQAEGEPVIAPLSPATISVFMATFGGVGIILTTMFKMKLLMSLPISAVSGFVVSAFVFVLFYHLFTKVQASSETRMSEVLGLTAEVTVPIAASGVGEIAYVCRGARLVSPARSQTGQPLARHAAVKVVRQVGTTLYVEPAVPEGARPAAGPDEEGPLHD